MGAYNIRKVGLDLLLIAESVVNGRIEQTVLLIDHPVLPVDLLCAVLHGLKTVELRLGIFALGIFVLDETAQVLSNLVDVTFDQRGCLDIVRRLVFGALDFIVQRLCFLPGEQHR